MTFTEPYRIPITKEGIDLDLSKNEGRPVDPSILDDIVSRPGLFNRYPDSTSLRARIAGLRRVEEARVLVTAGGDDALLRSCSALIKPGGRTVTTTPTFEMVPRYATLARADLVEVPWMGGPFPLDYFDEGKVAIVVSPNNPSGEVISDTDLTRLAQSFDHVILDGAYTEFAEDDLTPTALSLPNVVMIRTLSKAWGLAGLRVGYLLGEAEPVKRIAAHGNPYPVSRLSLAVAEARLAGGGVDQYVTRVRAERLRFANLLDGLGLRTIPSQGNFVYAETERPHELAAALAELGIAIRTFPGRPGLERSLRVTMPGDDTEFKRLTAAVSQVLEDENGSAR